MIWSCAEWDFWEIGVEGWLCLPLPDSCEVGIKEDVLAWRYDSELYYLIPTFFLQVPLVLVLIADLDPWEVLDVYLSFLEADVAWL